MRGKIVIALVAAAVTTAGWASQPAVAAHVRAGKTPSARHVQQARVPPRGAPLSQEVLDRRLPSMTRALATTTSSVSGIDAIASAAGVAEVVSARTQTSRTYQLPDGRRAAVIGTQPLNFRDSTGAWQSIDDSLVSDSADAAVGFGIVTTAAGGIIDSAIKGIGGIGFLF